MTVILYLLAFVFVVTLVCAAIVFVSNPTFFVKMKPQKKTINDLINDERTKLNQAERDRDDLESLVDRRRREMSNSQDDMNTLEAKITRLFKAGEDDEANGLASRYDTECDDFEFKKSQYESSLKKLERAKELIKSQRHRVAEAEDSKTQAELDKRLAELEADHYESSELDDALDQKISDARRAEIKRDLAKGPNSEKNQKFKEAAQGGSSREKRMAALKEKAQAGN